MEKTSHLLHGKYYHIYNKGINGINLFYKKENYLHFMQLYDDYISGVAETYAWCLLPNHFHLLVRIKTEEEIGYYLVDETLPGSKNAGRFGSKNADRFKTTGNLPAFAKPGSVLSSRKPDPTHHFSHMFNAFAKAINEQHSRTGSLFQKSFKRIMVDNTDYFKNLILYIHNNPVKHGFVASCSDYPWSSYGSVISIKSTKIERTKILGWFNDKAGFINAHNRKDIEIDEIFMME